MPAKKISELEAVQSTQLVNNDLLTIVDSSETDITNINKKITIGEFVSFLRDSSLFPISFNNSFINPAAYIKVGEQLVETPISNKVKGQLNLSEYSKILIDDYGRIYDAEELVEAVDLNILYASGTCATLIKDRSVTGDSGNPRPNQTKYTDQTIGGYFNENSYFNPGKGPNNIDAKSQGNPSTVNYSDRQNNDQYWDYLFSINYQGVKRTTVQLYYLTQSGFNGTGFLDIDWANARLNGNLLLPSNNGNNFPFIFENNSISAEDLTYTPKGQNFGGSNGLVQPKAILNGSERKIKGLPIPTFLEDKATNPSILNSSIAMNVIIKSFK